jgi:hypothetical protein
VARSLRYEHEQPRWHHPKYYSKLAAKVKGKPDMARRILLGTCLSPLVLVFLFFACIAMVVEFVITGKVEKLTGIPPFHR